MYKHMLLGSGNQNMHVKGKMYNQWWTLAERGEFVKEAGSVIFDPQATMQMQHDPS